MSHASMQSIALRYFLEVVRSGSVNEASVHLNVAASAVSRQIAKLEYELGTPLFERRARGMLPTAAGELLAGYARKAQLEVGQLVEELGQLQGLQRGHVRMACSQGFAIDFLPDAIAAFRAQHQGITFNLEVTTPDDVSRRVREGKADLGLTYSLAPEADIAIECAVSGPVMAVLPGSHRISVTLQTAQEVMLTLDGQVGFELRDHDVVEVSQSRARVRLVRFPERHFFSVLRTKLKWGER